MRRMQPGPSRISFPVGSASSAFHLRRRSFRPDVTRLEHRVLLTSDLALDPTFGSGGVATLGIPGSDFQGFWADTITSDGKLVAVGDVAVGRSAGSLLDNSGSALVVARFNADGSLDTTFGGTGWVETSLAYPLDRLQGLPAGMRFQKSSDREWLGYLSGDTVPTVSSEAQNEYAECVTVQPDGKIVVGGTLIYQIGRTGLYPSFGGENPFYTLFPETESALALVRYNPDGTLDTTFGDANPHHPGQQTGCVITEQTADHVLSSFVNNTTIYSFAGDSYGQDSCAAVTLQADGKIVGVGYNLARFNSDGSLDTSFGDPDPNHPGQRMGWVSLLDQQNGQYSSIAMAGTDIVIGAGAGELALARFDSTGQPVTGFGQNGWVYTALSSDNGDGIDTLVVQDDKIIVAGYTNNVYGQATSDAIVARYNLADGSLDTTFGDADPNHPGQRMGWVITDFVTDSGRTAEFDGLSVQQDGTIEAAGPTQYEATPGYLPDYIGVAAALYSADGELITKCLSSQNATDTPHPLPAVAIQADGKVVATAPGQYDLYRYDGPQAIVSQVQVTTDLTNLVSIANSSGQPAQLTLQVSTTDPTQAAGQVQDVITALATLPASTGAMTTVTINLTGGTYQAQTSDSSGLTPVTVPHGVQLVLVGPSGGTNLKDWTFNSGSITVQGGVTLTDPTVNGGTVSYKGTVLQGNSPALVVNGGVVILDSVTASNDTNTPTIVLNGGSLKIRNSTIQESTGYAQAAIQVNGGTVDLGTAADPGNNTLNVNGAGTLIQNTTGNAIPAVGDTFENDGVAAPSIFVLNPTAKGALTLAGNSSIAVPGVVIVDSSSTAAVSTSGNSVVSSPMATGVAVPDPLAGLSGPGTTGLTSYGSLNLSKGSLPICPGIYSQIKVSGNASLTLNPGTYIIEGGGLTVTGNASINGSSVMIYNAGSNYPGSGGSFGGITLSGNGTFNLSSATTGTYAGVLIFQSRQNTRALSFSGNAMAGVTGTIYAADALLSMTGNAQLTNPLIVGTLNLSGNVALTQTAVGGDGTGDTARIANTLMAGDLNVYINDPSGLLTADELARIQDAVSTWDALLAPYNVTINVVTDPTQANMVIDTNTSSACGGMSNGVLGCFNEPNAEITMIQGWSWYAGADPTQIGAGQYDFETTVLHELGHALGLGGGSDPSSPMYETLAAGTTARVVTVADLNIPDPPAGADPQSARPLPHVLPAAPVAQPTLNQNVALMALDMAIADLSGTGLGKTQRKRT
jgi:uncharacterized delta-60 repeat protein